MNNKYLYRLNGALLRTSDGKLLGYEKASYEKNFADNTWEQIQNGLAAGNPMGWAVGGTKSLTLTNGDTYTIRLVDLQEGRYESTTGVKCHGTFEFVECLKGINRAMNSTQKTYGSNTSYTAGGWLNSDMRAYMQGDVLALIPDELKNFMLLNKVGSASYGGSGQTDTAAGGVIIYSDGDKLFLAAQSEFFASSAVCYNTELAAYPQFDYYVAHNTNNDRIKKQLDSTGVCYYWNRSPSYDFGNLFCYAGGDGRASSNIAYDTLSVAPCFTL